MPRKSVNKMIEDTYENDDETTNQVEAVDPSVESDTMFGDVRDAILDRIRNLQKPWQQMTEREQRDMVESVSIVARSLVSRAVALVSKDGRRTIEAQIESVTIKDGVKAVLKCSKKADDIHELSECVGSLVLVVTNSAENYMGEKAPAKVDPDQPQLPVEEEDDQEAA